MGPALTVAQGLIPAVVSPDQPSVPVWRRSVPIDFQPGGAYRHSRGARDTASAIRHTRRPRRPSVAAVRRRPDRARPVHDAAADPRLSDEGGAAAARGPPVRAGDLVPVAGPRPARLSALPALPLRRRAVVALRPGPRAGQLRV